MKIWCLIASWRNGKRTIIKGTYDRSDLPMLFTHKDNVETSNMYAGEAVLTVQEFTHSGSVVMTRTFETK